MGVCQRACSRPNGPSAAASSSADAPSVGCSMTTSPTANATPATSTPLRAPDQLTDQPSAAATKGCLKHASRSLHIELHCSHQRQGVVSIGESQSPLPAPCKLNATEVTSRSEQRRMLFGISVSAVHVLCAQASSAWPWLGNTPKPLRRFTPVHFDAAVGGCDVADPRRLGCRRLCDGLLLRQDGRRRDGRCQCVLHGRLIVLLVLVLGTQRQWPSQWRRTEHARLAFRSYHVRVTNSQNHFKKPLKIPMKLTKPPKH